VHILSHFLQSLHLALKCCSAEDFLKVVGPGEWLQPCQNNIQQVLDFFAAKFSYHPPAYALVSGATSSSSSSSSSSAAADAFVSDSVPSSEGFKSSDCSSSDQARQHLVRAFLNEVFPAVKGCASAMMTEEQKSAALKRKKIMELLGLVVVKRKEKSRGGEKGI
jgi:hypothetical protein